MDRKSIANLIAECHDLPKGFSGKIADTVFDSIANALIRHEEVKIHGLGAFVVNDRPARTGRNPLTGEAIDVAASKVVKFSATKPLKDRVNGK